MILMSWDEKILTPPLPLPYMGGELLRIPLAVATPLPCRGGAGVGSVIFQSYQV